MNEKIFVRRGNMFALGSTADQYEKLPVGTYLVGCNPMTQQFFLELGESFKAPAKIYGNPEKLVKRFLHTYLQRGVINTGILLQGEKGSGKTLTAKLLSIRAAEAGMPTILVNEPWAGENFNTFIQDIDQPCLLIFDEFEKVYGFEEQTKLLTLLDGVHPSGKLIVFTSNEYSSIERHLINRPGRIFYSIKFGSLSEDFIREYCTDNLKDKTYIDEICRITSLFDRFNFDMLAALVEDMNRYDEDPIEAISYLNINIDQNNNGRYKAELKMNGKKAGHISPSIVHGHPFTIGDISIFSFTGKGEAKQHTFTVRDLQNADTNNGVYEYRSGTASLTLTKEVHSEFSLADPYWQQAMTGEKKEDGAAA